MSVWTSIGRMLVGAPAPARQEHDEHGPEHGDGANGLARRPSIEIQQVVNLIQDFRDHLRAQDSERHEIMRILGMLPDSLGALPRIASQQDRLSEILGQALAQAKARDAAVDAALARIADGIGHQTEVAGLIQQQLDLNMQAAAGVAEGVSKLSGAVTDLASSSRQSTDLLTGVVKNSRDQAEQHLRMQRKLQAWLLAVLGASGAVLIAAVILAWVALARK